MAGADVSSLSLFLSLLSVRVGHQPAGMALASQPAEQGDFVFHLVAQEKPIKGTAGYTMIVHFTP